MSSNQLYISYIHTYLIFPKNDTREKNEQTIWSKTHKAQGALTAVSKTTNRQTYQKRFIKLVKSTLESEHLNLDNVLKSTIFTGSEFKALLL